MVELLVLGILGIACLAVPVAVLVIVLIKGKKKTEMHPGMVPCPKCSSAVSPSATSCPACGHPLGQ